MGFGKGETEFCTLVNDVFIEDRENSTAEKLYLITLHYFIGRFSFNYLFIAHVNLPSLQPLCREDVVFIL